MSEKQPPAKLETVDVFIGSRTLTISTAAAQWLHARLRLSEAKGESRGANLAGASTAIAAWVEGRIDLSDRRAMVATLDTLYEAGVAGELLEEHGKFRAALQQALGPASRPEHSTGIDPD